MQQDMTNIAYTKEYADSVRYYENALFEAENLREETHKRINDEMSVYTRDYVKENFDDKLCNCSYRLSGSDHIIYRNGEKIYIYKALNRGTIYSVFTHQNGHKYLVFTKDLYGYSVLDLNTMQIFDYFPAASLHQDTETFIWCNLHYNAENNMAAVEGCFWAAPSGVLLTDFTDPMKQAPQIDVNHKIYEEDNEVNFISWNRTDLILSVGYSDDEIQKVITSDEYMSWLKQERR